MHPKLMGYLLLTVVFALLGFFAFFTVAMPPVENPPFGPVDVGIGPTPDVFINKTEVFVDIPENELKIRVTYKFDRIQKYFIYAILPYTIDDASPYAIYNSQTYYSANKTIGDLSTNYLNTVKGSSVINASINMNDTFPFAFQGPDLQAEITLGVSIELNASLIAIYHPLGAKQTVILTFFGDYSTVITDEMYVFMNPNHTITIQYPFIVHLRIPSKTYFHQSQPSPIEYYVRGERRWIMFSMDFLDGRYAQTLFCSFTNPTVQAWKEIFVFIGGVLVAVSGSFAVEAYKNYSESHMTKSCDGKKETKAHTHEPSGIEGLIDIVDEDVSVRWHHVITAYIPFAIISVIIVPVVFAISVTLGYMSISETNMLIVSLVVLCVALASLGTTLPKAVDSILIDRFHKAIIRNRGIVLPKNKILLKALIKMKMKQLKFSLAELYAINDSIFDETELLELLYE